jgi:hypothetical protein
MTSIRPESPPATASRLGISASSPFTPETRSSRRRTMQFVTSEQPLFTAKKTILTKATENESGIYYYYVK